MTILADVPMIQYVADSFGGERPPSLNSSVAHLLLTRSPAHAQWNHPRLSAPIEEKDDTKFNVGIAAHALLLEGRDDGLEIIDAPNWLKKEHQLTRKAARAAGKVPLLTHQLTDVIAMVAEARRVIEACPDLEGYGLGEMLAEQTILWHAEWIIGGGPVDAWCRCRPDWLSRDRRLIVSYKTTAASAEPDAFTRILLSSGYVLQSRFELQGVADSLADEAEKTGNQGLRTVLTKYVWLVQETAPPFACSLIGLSPAMADLGRRQFRTALVLWSECVATGEWPSYPARVCYVDPPEWAVASFNERENAYANVRDEEVSAL